MNIDEYKSQFGNLAEEYTKFRRPYERELTELFFAQAPKDEIKILDLACGTGKFTETLVRENTEVFGSDIDPLMIKEAQSQATSKNFSINYSVGESEKLPYNDEEFDAVSVGTAFHWFVNQTSMAEIRRVLKPGGLLFIFWTLTVKDIPEEDSIPREFLNSFNWVKVPSELRDLAYISNFLSQNGFADVSTSRIPSINSYTVEEYVGLMKTSANFGLLSNEEKTRFVTELTAILSKQLGSREVFTLEDEIQVVYSFKK